MIQKTYRVTDIEMARFSNDVVCQSFVGSLERASSAEKKAAAEGIEALIVNTIDDDEVLLIHEGKRRGNLVDLGQRTDLVAESFLHHGAGKSKKYRRIWRLHEKIGSHAFDALSPFRQDTGSEARNHKNENDLNGDGSDAEKAPEWTGDNVSPEHLKLGETSFESVVHEAKPRSYCIIEIS